MTFPVVPPPQDPEFGRTYVFGPFRLLKVEKQLLENGLPVRLGSRALNLLLALVERPAEVLSRTELEARVWPKTVVEETSLRVHIAALRKALHDGVDGATYIANIPGRGYCFVADVEVTQAQLQPAAHMAPEPTRAFNNLPSRFTEVVGRQEVTVALGQHLMRHGLVSIVGSGGIGKTTVALAVAWANLAKYRDGIVFVDLAPLTDPDLVPSALAFALGCPAPSQSLLSELCEFLRKRCMLLLLDNCEHLIDAAARLAENILRIAPGVHILATTREPLFAQDEWIYRLSALDTPRATDELTTAQAMGYSAIRLFVERAEAGSDDFILSADTLPAIRQLCQRLDGIPLAIELAAARVRSLGVLGLSQRLDKLFQLLTSGRRTSMQRHQTLDALLGWSYQLLSRTEQIVLERLSVFCASFTLEWATAVAASHDLPAADVVASVLTLADKSLVRVETTGSSAQYRLLHMTRDHAARKLAQSGELQISQRKHAELFLVLAETVGAQWGELSTADRVNFYSRLIDDFRIALDWTFSNEGDDKIGVSLTIAVWIPVCGLGLYSEYRTRIERGLERVVKLSPPQPQFELRLCVAWCFLSGQSPDIDRAFQQEIFQRTLALAQASDVLDRQVEAFFSICAGSMGQGRYDLMENLAHRIRSLATGSLEPLSVLLGDRMNILAQHYLGHHAQARALMKSVLEYPVEKQHQWLVGQVPRAVSLGIVEARILWLEGSGEKAADAARQAIDHAMGEHPFALAQALALGATPIALWTGDLALATDWTDALLDHSTRHALGYWQSWGASYRLALQVKGITGESARSRLATTNPAELDMLATLSRAFLTPETMTRLQDGHVGWCGPEVLRAAGENALQAKGTAATAQALELFLRGLKMAQDQGAVAWELRLALSLATLWRRQGRTQQAQDILYDVLDKFTEGFGTYDLVQARQFLHQLQTEALSGQADLRQILRA